MIAGIVAPQMSRAAFEDALSALRRGPADAGSLIDIEHRVAVVADTVLAADDCYWALSGRLWLKGRPGSLEEVASILAEDHIRGSTRLSGTFSLAAVRPKDGRVVLAIDKMGVGRLTHSQNPESFVFSDNALVVADITGGKSVSHQAIHDFLFFHMVPSPDTIFRGVAKLPRAHCLEWRPGRPANVTEYWQPEFASGPASVDELNEELHGALASSVGRAMTQADCGAFLSGGLDSSTVSGYFRSRFGRDPQRLSLSDSVFRSTTSSSMRVSLRSTLGVMP